MTAIYRPEHPNPQCERAAWINLNGEWQFETDCARSGFERRLFEADALKDRIQVPFCPESELSGIGNRDFMPCVWYRREMEIPAAWLEAGRHIFLHFGACDFETHVYVNGREAGVHYGGYASFSFEITSLVTAGKNILTVAAVDDTRSPMQATGKQSMWYASRGCHYTRVTGIWQTVWLEMREASYIESFRFFPNAADGTVTVEGKTVGCGTVHMAISFAGRPVGEATVSADASVVAATIALSEKHLWDLGQGNLYDVELRLGDDVVKTYFGLRDIHFDGMKFMLNGRSVYQRLVLDQGFYPDGIYTAPSDEALCRDVELSMAAGFNGARLHQKVFEPRFLYHCDRLGYIVWGEYGDWGLDYSDAHCIGYFLPEWLEILARDCNHPAIVGWCPFNETWDYQGHKRADPAVFRTAYYTTKAFDPTRPVIDTSGGFHVISDIYDHHDYEQDPARFRERYMKFHTDRILDIDRRFKDRERYVEGQPFFISEYGGLGLSVREGNWGYRDVKSVEEFYESYRGLTDALLDNPSMFGFCYTQLYDVEQEENGLYTYAREPKVDIEKIRAINTRAAAIEQ